VMVGSVDNNSVEGNAGDVFYRTAVRTAVLSGLFCLIVGGFLIYNYVMRTGADERRVNELDELKVEVQNKPDDEQLIARFRKLDLQVRKTRVRRLDFSRRGGYLLFGGAIVFFAGLLWVVSFRRKVAYPKGGIDYDEIQIRESALSRRSVGVGAIGLAVAGLLLAITIGPEFPTGASDGLTLSGGLVETWSSFRGLGGSGVYEWKDEVSSSWNGKSGEGIIWKSEVSLSGYGSPIVWKDRVFVSGADANSREVYCFDAVSGERLWASVLPKIAEANAVELEVMEDTGYAASTMVSDGRRVCAIFANGNVGCFNFEGKRLWSVGLGVPDSTYGYASSLAIYRNILLIQYDQSYADAGKSVIKGLNVLTGDILWQTPRPVSSSWCSPIVIKAAGREQVITCSDPLMIAYDPNNGAELWRADCLGGEIASSPIYTGEVVIGLEPYTKLVGVRPDGHGDVTKTHVAWSVDAGAPDICSPVSNGELVFLLTTDGTLSCFKVSDGSAVWEHQLKGDFKASPSLVNGRLYILSEQGVMIIADISAGFSELAQCALGERCYASPAFADGRIYIRGVKNLYCIGSDSKR